MTTETSNQTSTTSADAAPPDDRKAALRAQLLKGQERMRELREAGWKPVHRNPAEQAAANPNSLKAAIKAFCWTCVGQDADPGAKFRVRDCAVGAKCPLFAHRPWQNVKGGLALNAEGVLEVEPGSEDETDSAD